MEIVEVKDKKDETLFLDAARAIYRNNTEWVCPPDDDIRAIFSAERNPGFEQGGARRWVLLEGREIMGRIAAFYDRKKLKPEQPPIAGAGFFECVDNLSASRLLFDTAGEWLRRQGFVGMDAPINFGERDKYWGLLVKGFHSPSYQDNYNPPYYEDLFEKYGFMKLFEQSTYTIRKEIFNYGRISRIGRRVFEKPYRFEHFDRKQTDRFAADFVHIYNNAWQDHEAFIPVSFSRIKELMKDVEPIVQPEMIWFAYVGDEPAGFFVTIPDINPLIKPFKGKFGVIKKLLLLARLRTARVRRCRGIVFGIVPRYQKLGLDAGLIMKYYEAMSRYPHITEFELSWIGDFNPGMQSILKAIGAEPSKTHYTYRKLFPVA